MKVSMVSSIAVRRWLGLVLRRHGGMRPVGGGGGLNEGDAHYPGDEQGGGGTGHIAKQVGYEGVHGGAPLSCCVAVIGSLLSCGSGGRVGCLLGVVL